MDARNCQRRWQQASLDERPSRRSLRRKCRSCEFWEKRSLLMGTRKYQICAK
jgi:hypothetical protein